MTTRWWSRAGRVRGFGALMLLALALALGGCGSLRDGGSARSGTAVAVPAEKEKRPVPVVRATPEPVAPVSYADYVQRLGLQEQEREIERQRVAFSRDKSDVRRLYYGMALALASSTPANRRAAAPVLEPLLKDVGGRDPDVRAVAGLVMALIQEQRRGDELERKLDAVKEIERTLMQRERMPPTSVGTGSGGRP
jgi:hypothetical protein